MTKTSKLKVHTPISSWRNLNEHVAIGDIVYVTLPIEQETIRFRLHNNHLTLELEEASKLNREEIENLCYDLLGRDDWSNQFIGYAYPLENGLSLYAIYDLTFQVYLDGLTVQRLADIYGFVPHPIIYHGSVKPFENETVSEFLARELSKSRRKASLKKSGKEHVVVENVSRLYEYRRIIGAWHYPSFDETIK